MQIDMALRMMCKPHLIKDLYCTVFDVSDFDVWMRCSILLLYSIRFVWLQGKTTHNTLWMGLLLCLALYYQPLVLDSVNSNLNDHNFVKKKNHALWMSFIMNILHKSISIYIKFEMEIEYIYIKKTSKISFDTRLMSYHLNFVLLSATKSSYWISFVCFHQPISAHFQIYIWGLQIYDNVKEKWAY